MAAPLTLRAAYHPPADGGDGNGTVSLELAPTGDLPAGWRLALTSVLPLRPPADAARLARRVATYHELEPVQPVAASPVWRADGVACGFRARHANDGPTAAFVILPDGSTRDVDVVPMRHATHAPDDPRVPVHDAGLGRDPSRRPERARPRRGGAVLPLVPMPRRIEVRGDERRRRVHVADGPASARAAGAAVESLAARLLGAPADAGPLDVTCRVDDRLADEAYRIDADGERAVVVAAGDAGFRHALVTLWQLATTGMPERVVVDDAPRWSWRGLHVDLARRWYEPADVERLVDLAAWRKLDRLHLHLTDDEAWRLPVPGWPELAAVGGTRGHGLALPPMLGSGAAPYGRAYTAGEIAGWVARADELGVVLVPEVDVPAHCHAALTARPDLRDPDDTSAAASVQDFVDNVLVPGLPATEEFLTAVFDALAALFPSSPWLHVGGDEVPRGAWRGSPVVAEHRRTHGLETTRDVERDVHQRLTEVIRRRTGRRIGAWQEAAQSGGVRPGDGYVVGWTSADVSRELAAAGHDVVVAPGQAYYLDMAPDDAWDTPGMSWAGTVPFEDTCAFEPDAGWDDDERSHLLGVQACLWSEHVADTATFDRLAFPRLDAVAERAWTGRVDGGPSSLRARAAAMPRLAR